MSYRGVNGMPPTRGSESNALLRTIASNYFSYTFGLVVVVLMILGGLVFITDLGVDVATYIRLGNVKDHVKDLRGHLKDVCDDGNVCTESRQIEGGCVQRPKPSGTACETACYKPEVDPLMTQVCEMPRGCTDCVKCVGTECAGSCAVDEDCPVLASSVSALGNASTTCQQSACLSTIDVTGLFPELTEACDSQAKPFVDTCASLLEPTVPVVMDSCLTSYPVCVNGTLASCLYTFDCAPLVPIILP